MLSEGAAVLCLEDMDHARERGAIIYGEITGYGSYSDASDMTAPAADLLARVASIRSACTQADKGYADIGYINAHGTSTPLNDANETASIKQRLVSMPIMYRFQAPSPIRGISSVRRGRWRRYSA